MHDTTVNEVLSRSDDDTLEPVRKEEKTWGWFAIFNVWANDIQTLSDACYVRAYPAATAEAWADGHVHAFAFFEPHPVQDERPTHVS